MYGVKECVVCVICITRIEVLYISVEVWYLGDEYEESYECLFVLAEISCMFLYCIWIILAMYTGIVRLRTKATEFSYVYFYIVHKLH